jgi:Periplasmic binding protein-like domain/PIN domain
VWELTIKTMLGRLSVPADFSKRLTAQGLALLSITAEHAEAIRNFPELVGHDPFDRLLAAQASRAGLRLLTADQILSAFGALDALAEHGLEVPRDMSVAGYDNTPVAVLRTVSLTTVDQFAAEIGAEAMRSAAPPHHLKLAMPACVLSPQGADGQRDNGFVEAERPRPGMQHYSERELAADAIS